ncbi:MAG: NADPH-dependent 7-cyano-7-deazaguanine reductase QueF [Candidatus Acididesulfobacter diazotrophicus]|uniref:NADPH-dependent 7-cyano-7-deazaguanine reductase n=1 Tax=Candidatus Acididesulfobacter diazotrophicus TaxID=2597226 RepID=A0A519BNM6_9DELT|nr:MAG: NADPH-dependent 7-cyano-7-deazaguanine reductase QueF [Candidatus Acididesulfobacter diazotrophicus]
MANLYEQYNHYDDNKYKEKRFDIKTEDSVDVKVLETIPFCYPLSQTKVSITTKEFTSVCPWSGLPDTAELNITYTPNNHLVEMKSLKYYLLSFRNIGILQEHAVNRILNDLAKLLEPKNMEVEAKFESRGGLDTVVKVEYNAANVEK